MTEGIKPTTEIDNNSDSDSDSDSGIPLISTVLFVIMVLIIIIILVYFFWYADRDHLQEDFEPLPDDLFSDASEGSDDDTIISVFEKIKDRYGSHVAIKALENPDKPVHEDSAYYSVNYREYWDNSEAFSQKLLYFIGPHPRVAILSFNRPEWFYVHLGTMMSNGVSIGIYPTASSDNCKYIINHSHVDLLIVENVKQLAKLKDSTIETVRLILMLDDVYSDMNIETQELIDTIRSANPNLEILSYHGFMSTPFDNNMNTEIEVSKPHPEDVATIIYTSGTTGPPKGVVQTHGSIVAAIKNCLYAIRSRSNIDISVGERFVSYLPLNHIAAQMMDLYVPICSVGRVTFAGQDALRGSLKHTLVLTKPTIFIGVPRVWEKIEESINKELESSALKRLVSTGKIIRLKLGLDQAKYCIAAAAPLSDSTRKFFDSIGIELCNVYGMSETCGPISVGVPGSSKGAGVPVMDVKINKESSEIMVRGSSLFKEYYKDKDSTKKSFKRQWFKTGDTGHIDRSGSLYVTGRIKDIIITAGGENISPIPIEESICTELKYRHIDVEHVVVIGNNKKYISVLAFCKPESRDKLSKSMDSVLAKVNKIAPNSASTVKKYLVLGQDLEIGSTLTPTLKIRRVQIDETFSVEINNLYDD